MNIILGTENIQEVGDKHIVLELDTLVYPNSDAPVTAYCLVEATGLDQLMGIDQWLDLHNKLMENYKKGDFRFCKSAIEHLIGKFNGELDTFYSTMLERVKVLEKESLPENWTGVIEK